MEKLEQLSEIFDNDAVIFLSTRDFMKIKNEVESFTSIKNKDVEWYKKGFSYGIFETSKATELGFMSVYINGKTFHINTENNLMKMVNHSL